MKVNSVLEEIDGSRQTMSQILRTTFQSQIGDQEKLGTGQTAWDCHPGIRIEGPLLTFECKTDDNQGARYFKQLSPEFPHFEVIIIETGKERRLGIGIVNEGYDNTKMPGKDEGSVGYDTDDGFINIPNVTWCGLNEDPKAGQGDLVRCTVMFEKKEERFGRDQVPVYFTLNGKIISHFSQSLFYTDCDKPLFPFISMTEGSSVLAKMCAKEDAEHHSPQLQEIKVDPADVAPSETGALKDNSPDLEEIKADLVDVVKHIQDVKSDLAGLQENLKDLVSREVKEATRCLEEKLDALMARLSEKK